MSSFRRILWRAIVLFLVPSAILSVLWSATPVGAALLYQLQDIGTVTFSSATDINNNGVVVGNYSISATATSASSFAFIYANGTTTTLATTGGSGFHANAINDSNQVVGYFHSSSQQHAFVYLNGITIDLGTLGYGTVDPMAINNSGQIVGGNLAQPGSAFLYSGGTKSNLYPTSVAYGINNSSESVVNLAPGGVGSVLFSGTTELNYLGSINGLAISDSGEIVGYNASGAALYFDGVTSNLGTPGGSQSIARAVNSSGEIVGDSSIDAQFDYHAFLYTGGGPMLDLNSLLEPAPGWTVTFAFGINDAGDIVGEAIDPNGHTDAVLLTPVGVPEPVTFGMLGLPMLAFLLGRRRKTFMLAE